MSGDLCIEAVILAGGLGTRLRSVVPDLPKPMAPVAGKPFLEHVLNRLQQQGIVRVILSVGYRAEAIQNYFGTAYRGIEIAYALEEEPLGTGGAMAFALSFATSDRILVLNGDSFLDVNYRSFAEECIRSDASLGIVVRPVENTHRYGRCELDNGTVVSFSEKSGAGPGLINGGVYCLKKNLFEDFPLPARFSFEQDFVARYLEQIRPLGFPVEAYFIDIGIPEDFERAQQDFAEEGSPQ